MLGAKLLITMLIFNFLTVMGGYADNSLLNKFIIMDTEEETVISSNELTTAINTDFNSTGSVTVTNIISSYNPLIFMWNFFMFLMGTLFAPFMVFGFGLPLMFAVPLFIVWFIMYMFSVYSLLRGVSF